MRLFQGAQMQSLSVDGKDLLIDSTYSLRWVEQKDGPAYPVLYQNGKRIIKKWSIRLSFDCPDDPFGGNANTN
jgi:hypothetical protein